MCALYVASSAGTGLAEATLVDAAGEKQEQWMARWAGLGAVGDLLAPLLVAAVAWVGLGWRAGVAGVGLGTLGYAALLARHPFPAPEVEEEEALSLGASLRAAATHPDLLRWLFAASLCALLDEAFVALAALHLEAAHGAGEASRGLLLALLTVAMVLGLGLAERALDRGAEPMRLLRAACVGATASLLAWWAAPDLGSAALALLGLGLFVGPLWPIAKAQAFRALPGQGALVELAAVPFGAVELALPLALGAAADAWGLRAALLLLLAQPLALLALSGWPPASPPPPAAPPGRA